MSEQDTEYSEEQLDEDEEGMPDLSSVLERFKRQVAEEIHVASPGITGAVDMTSGRCSAQAAVGKAGASVEPSIPDVPLMQLRSGDAYVSMPVTAGSSVMMIYADRSTDEWSSGNGGSTVKAQDPRSHDPSDAMALPFAAGAAPTGRENDVAIGCGGGEVAVTEDGVIEILPKAGEHIDLGAKEPDDYVLLGTKFDTDLDDFIGTILSKKDDWDDLDPKTLDGVAVVIDALFAAIETLKDAHDDGWLSEIARVG